MHISAISTTLFRVLLGLSCSTTFAQSPNGVTADLLRLHLRTRFEPFKGTGQWKEMDFDMDLSLPKTALLICDMWDQHWCQGATRRVGILAEKMDPVLIKARARGLQVIHAPSDTMEFYKDYPQRRRMLEIAKVPSPASLELKDPPLPIDDLDGGCDTTGDTPHTAWTRQHPAISIGPDDVISDNGTEVYSFLHDKGIKNLLICGVHTNMCILGRSFAIRQMVNWGIRCILIRDLTDAMYDPKDRPYVSHERGTALVIEHIEKYWCPSTTSADLLAGLKSR